MTKEKLLKEFHEIQKTTFCGERWSMWEHNLYGEDVPAIVTNMKKYVYTEESLFYTLDNMEYEFDVHLFAKEA